MLLMVEAATATQFPSFVILLMGVGFMAAATLGSIAWFRSKRPLGWEDAEGNKGTANQPGEQYDRGLTSAETAARQDREGASFRHKPESDDGTDTGYTTDREGLLNNYAIEPEMYVEQPGDLRSDKTPKAKQTKQPDQK